MRVAYRIFRSTFSSWDQLFADAAAFATTLGPDRLISISHSEDKDDGVVTVWYWDRPYGETLDPYDPTRQR